MSASEDAKNIKLEEEAAAEAEARDAPAAADDSEESQPEHPAEMMRSDEKPGANEVRVTDKRRFSTAGDPTAAAETEEMPAAASAAPEGIEELRARVKEAEEKQAEAERQVQDYAERFRHAQRQLRAENDELRARLQRNFEQKLETARGDLVASLLDVFDNLKRAVAAAESQEERGPEFESLLNGVRATAELFEARLRSLGLTPVAGAGEEFNPEIHEAVEVVSAAPEQDNRVIEELQPGYKFGERLLRPARVRVGRASD
jgi:molecular chaperone GrpE